MADEECRQMCLVTLAVPAPAADARFRVRQEGRDHWVTIRSSAVVLGRLELGTEPWYRGIEANRGLIEASSRLASRLRRG